MKTTYTDKQIAEALAFANQVDPPDVAFAYERFADSEDWSLFKDHEKRVIAFRAGWFAALAHIGAIPKE